MVAPTFTTKGFTLIEMIVAIAIFSIVMVVSTSTLLTLFNSYKASHALESVLDNLSSALDTMSRNTRFGSNYACGHGSNCKNTGDTAFSFLPYSGGAAVVYELYNGAIWQCSGSTAISSPSAANGCTAITAPDVHVTQLAFYVDTTNASHSSVFVIVNGYALFGLTQLGFNLQTLVSER